MIIGLVTGLRHLRRNKRIFILSLAGFCLLMIIVTALTNSGPTFLGKALSTITNPIQSGIMGLSKWTSDRIGFFRGMTALFEENQRLSEENAILRMDNSRMRLVDEENEKLAELLETRRRYADFPYLVGLTRAVDPGNWYKQFNIDIGSTHGVLVNMPVLADGALLGRVTEVWPFYSRVQSIIDDTSGVSARVFRSNHVGTVRGDVELMMEGLCLMEFTSLEVDIAVGDEIQTSQLSSYYPPGITIGFVESVARDSRGMTSAVIKPVADLSHVDYVLVITKLYDWESGD